MDISRLKKFAIEARENLIKGVVDRLKTLGFDEKGNVAESDRPVQMEGGSIFRGEIKSGDGFYKRWIALETAVKNHPHGPKVGLRQVAEEAAYTWFNRFVAIRILQKNRLIEPQLAYAEGGRIPLIVENARQGRLPTLDETERAELDALLDDDSKVLEQFTVLIVAYCHTTPILLNCFGHIDDYTELLLPTNILAAGIPRITLPTRITSRRNLSAGYTSSTYPKRRMRCLPALRTRKRPKPRISLPQPRYLRRTGL